jgi:hypothetical protein
MRSYNHCGFSSLKLGSPQYFARAKLYKFSGKFALNAERLEIDVMHITIGKNRQK